MVPRAIDGVAKLILVNRADAFVAGPMTDLLDDPALRRTADGASTQSANGA